MSQDKNGKRTIRSGVSLCDVCRLNKENVKVFRNEWGLYSACPPCAEEMKLTYEIMKISTKSMIKSGKYKINPNSIVLTPLE